MPLYEYECEKCHHRFERIQKFSDPLVKACPKCKGKVRKLFSAPAIQFKGQGWYITDYARKSESGGDKDGKKSSGEKVPSDAKPAKSDSDKSSGDKKPKK